MKLSQMLRLISFVMFIVAIVFIFCAIANPVLGQVIYIGKFEFGLKVWRVCYAVYVAIMIILFIDCFVLLKKIRQ